MRYIAAAALLAFLWWASWQNEKDWAIFRITHHCKVVEDQPDSQAWLCDDGAIYWRSK